MKNIVLTTLLLASLHVTASQADSNKLVWLMNDFPPFIDVSGSMPGRGIADELVRYLIPRMPEYQHEFEVASIARAHGLMEQGEQVCHPSLLMNEDRKRIMVFSDPVFFILTHRVLIRKDRLDRFSAYLMPDGSIDAKRLTHDPNLVTAITERRAYSPSINAALEDVADTRHILKAGVQFNSPFHQLMSGWIDYLFAYPVEYGWYRKQQNESSDVVMRTIPISGDPEFILGYVTCTKGLWGQKVIEQVNAAIKEAGPRPSWVQKTVDYTAPEEVERFEKAFERNSPFLP
ncbi:TIGR02285 family protein [Pseudomonas sp. D(2018)]|uniref:TIGR02285 family protein n=1 Tax=Pseudomonas sp. D(2018) TaxID=2502238 RepID=UPI001485AF5D|nr:TIGR02285 family protein [Pseudomonas sp. D(2018)]